MDGKPVDSDKEPRQEIYIKRIEHRMVLWSPGAGTVLVIPFSPKQAWTPAEVTRAVAKVPYLPRGDNLRLWENLSWNEEPGIQASADTWLLGTQCQQPGSSRAGETVVEQSSAIPVRWRRTRWEVAIWVGRPQFPYMAQQRKFDCHTAIPRPRILGRMDSCSYC